MNTAAIVLQKGDGLEGELRCEMLAKEKGYQVTWRYDFSERDYVDYEYIAEEHGYEDAIIFASKPKFGINIQEHLYFEWRAESTWVVEHAYGSEVESKFAQPIMTMIEAYEKIMVEHRLDHISNEKVEA